MAREHGVAWGHGMRTWYEDMAWRHGMRTWHGDMAWGEGVGACSPHVVVWRAHNQGGRCGAAKGGSVAQPRGAVCGVFGGARRVPR